MGELHPTVGPHIEEILCLASMLFDDLLEIPATRMSRDSIAEPAEVPALDRRRLSFSQKLVEVDHVTTVRPIRSSFQPFCSRARISRLGVGSSRSSHPARAVAMRSGGINASAPAAEPRQPGRRQ